MNKKFSRQYINRIFNRLVALLLMASLLIVVGCKKGDEPSLIPGSSILPPPTKPVTEAPTNDTNEIVIKGVFTHIDTASKKMMFLDMAQYVEYEVPYHGGTDIKTRYDTVIAASNMNIGEIYEVTCDAKGNAKSIYGAKDAWEKKSITGAEIDEVAKTITVGASETTYNNNTAVFADGERISMSGVVSQDEITMRGIGKTIYSITVDKSHGFLKLTGIDAFVNGYISVGKQQLLTVTEGMLVTVQEGTHNIELHNGSVRADKQVTITKGTESVLDFSEYIQPAKPNGVVKFMVTPKDAIMVLDGEEVDYSEVLTLPYGAHRIELKASKYEVYTETFIVDSAYETKIIDMVAKGTTTSTAASDDKTSGYKVNVTTPVGASLYVDSKYVGVVPCSFDKKAGNRIITLSKTGYQTVSYTISISNTTGDVGYAFPDMTQNSYSSVLE